jgi:hypothetical protein
VRETSGRGACPGFARVCAGSKFCAGSDRTDPAAFESDGEQNGRGKPDSGIFLAHTSGWHCGCRFWARVAQPDRQERRPADGTGIAFAGLILGYLQLAILAILFLGVLGAIQDIRRDLDKHPNTRTALLERIAHGDPYTVSPAKTARQAETAIQALNLIRAKETEYFTEHPQEGYACELYKVGYDPGGNTELNTLLRESDYDTKFIRCGQVPGVTPGTLMYPSMYLILSVPRSAGNTADAPVFCMDQVSGIEQYTPEESRDAIATIMTTHTDPCPLTGTHVE